MAGAAAGGNALQDLKAPQPVYTRPLLGIDWLGSPLNLKPGALLDAQGVVVRPRGLYRNPGYASALAGLPWSPADTPLLLVGAWGTQGIQYPYLFGQNYIFSGGGGGLTQAPWTYTTGTVTTTGNTTVTGSGTAWKTLGIQPGDLITIASVQYTIASITSDTVLVTTANVPSASGVSYSIARLMHAGNPYMVDACNATDVTLGPMLVVATFGNQLIAINPTTGAITNLSTSSAKQPTTGGIQAECCAYFAGRIFVGHLLDGSNGELRQFMRWSKATDITDFSDPTAYMNVVGASSSAGGVGSGTCSGAIRRFVPMGTMLVTYLDDAIFVGTPSNITNLPLAWQQLPTGGLGIAGPRAVASTVLPREETNIWGMNVVGHFFVGPDNVYFLSASSLSLQPIGSKVVKNSVLKCQNPGRIQAVVDWNQRRVRFGFPVASSYIENIYDFNWETKEWSYEARKTWMLADPFLTYSLSTQVMETSTGSPMCLVDGVTTMVSGWTQSTFVARAVYEENNGTLWMYSGAENATNPDGSANSIGIQTQDFDEGAPGMVKFWRRLSLKIHWDTAPGMDITFDIQVSMDMGNTWRDLGTLTILNGETEGWINFRAKGPHIRFKIASSTPCPPYYIVEMGRLVSLTGVQVSNRQQHALP